MTSTLFEELSANPVDGDTLHQTVRYYLAERLDDVTPEEMRDELTSIVGSSDIDAAIARLNVDTLLLENAALYVLSHAWADASERDLVREILQDAKGKLPVIEVGIISLAVVYGIYFVVTKGVRRSEETVVRKQDGSIEQRTVTEYHSPDAAVRAIVALFRPSAARDGSAQVSEPEPPATIDAPEQP